MNSGRFFALRLACLGVIAAFAASPSLPVVKVSSAGVQPGLAPEMQQRLTQMSTGVNQPVLLTGSDAQSRNARIPLASEQTRLLAAYAPIASGKPSYSTALRCMTQAIYYEAANETRDGKRAVAQVVLNRMRHPAFPNSVCGVVYQGVNDRVCQFSFTCDGALLRAPLERQWQESAGVARKALGGDQLRSVGTATHYHANYVVPRWAYTLTKLEVVGTHIFYRFPGAPGEPSAFSSHWALSESIPRINWSRFKASPEDVAEPQPSIEETWVPGLTVVPDQTDRHAESDVGGRLDTTKQWRLSVPDPTASSASYSAAVQSQSTASPQADETVQ